MTDISARLERLIAAAGPIPVALFMAEANTAYYAARDPLGSDGDFITAPEISQMFGELTGLCLADLWQRAGRPDAAYAELGPGRGTLAADALRAMRPAGLAPPVHFVETSPALREKQAERVAGAFWHDDIATLPADRPLLVVANEFFDALPVRQLIATYSGWRERLVTHDGEGFVAVPGAVPFDAAVPAHLRRAAPGSILETCPAAVAITRALAARIVAQGGAAIVIDYGYAEHAAGDTLQAVHAHAYADPFAKPGASDLTAHVDFAALAAVAAAEGAVVAGPVDQGAWLAALGLSTRAAMLAKATPARAAEIEAARARLADADQMGTLFKALAIVAPGWPAPAGFATIDDRAAPPESLARPA
ncbi:class I SAM-dependent methyltransferase [Sphingomonas solaris]|uniref:Class I SAM-dependent methyltransferase n=1 Tax=Alterirhizorhabdus solaris TaxID=2529389 RepID=A0A558QRD4_9SPHN|nr:SAM-dependent methyltransferase [Sphingomonas solaris]TVV69693.1 class I SAM-dependent methyltransferase [Sphingomonas solaris]